MSGTPSQDFDAGALGRDAPWVRRLASALVADPHAAEDVAQDALLLALERHPGARSSLRTWLRAVVRRMAQNIGRSQARRRARECAAARREAGPAADELVVRVSGMHILSEALLALEEPYRTAILLRYVEDLPPRHIAERLGVPVATVNSRLARGLERLRAQLDRSGQGREQWLAALVAWELPPRLLGALAMSTGTKVAVAGVGVVLALLLASRLEFSSLAPDPAGDAPTADIAHPGSEAAADSASGPEPRVASELRAAIPAAREVAAEASEAELRGVVVAGDGRPIAGARVTVSLDAFRQLVIWDEKGLGSERLAEAVTSPLGEFRFELEANRAYDLEATSDGFASTLLTDRYAGEFVRVELERAAAIRGVVTSAETGAPVSGVRVEASGTVLAIPGVRRPETTTDSRGAYALEGLTSGAYELAFEHPLYPRPTLALPVEEGEEYRRDVALPTGGVLRGLVRDAATGDPIAGARVSTNWMMRCASETALDGRFEVAWPSAFGRPGTLHVAARGYTRRSVQESQVQEPTLVVELSAGSTVRGRLLDPEGRAVSGAFVHAAARNELGPVSEIDHASTRADADGRFALADLRPDMRHTLVACSRGFAVLVVDLPEGAEEDGIADIGPLYLEPAGALGGRLVAPDGSPHAGLFVVLSGDSAQRGRFNGGATLPGGSPIDRITARTDERGRFSFPDLPAGQYFLSGGAKGFQRRAELEVELSSGEWRSDLVLTLDLGLSICGVVATASGQPIPRASIGVYRAGEFWNRLAYALADEHGRFALRGLEPGRYDVRADGGFSSEALDRALAEGRVLGVEAGADDVRVMLQESSPIRGRVLGLDGEPARGCIVQVEGERTQTTTDADGRFMLPVPIDATVDLTAFVISTDASGASRPAETAKVLGVPAGTQDVELQLRAP